VAGLKDSGNKDVALIASSTDCTAAAVFTRNQVVAAPVILDKEVLAKSANRIRGVVANAGNANACTGEQGMVDGRKMQRMAARHIGCEPDQIFILSTGVIGQLMPMDVVEKGIDAAAKEVTPDGGISAAEAIMTTDTRPKHVSVEVSLPGGTVNIGGVAKGSGMIHPNMATMLGLVTTDAEIAPSKLQELLGEAVDASFNRISVDGDTSTNDTVIALANGASRVGVDDQASTALFARGLTEVCQHLAKMIVRDGEGATKFVEISVSGAPDEAAAHRIAETIATSPLVKTAFAGSDANWGRILAAAGRAGVVFDQNAVDLWVGNEGPDELLLLQGGMPTDYREADAAAIFRRPEIKIHLRLAEGEGETTFWTTDLSHGYVTINADYRT
jgi:glutamate N-acetyltransferase/amino-acid N-acetyltransferase